MVSHGGSRITFQMFRCFHKICILYTEEKNRTANKWPPVTDWFDFGRRGECDLCSFPMNMENLTIFWQIWQFLTFLYKCVIAKLESSDEKVAVLQKEKVPTLLSGGVSCCCLWWHCFPCRCLLCSFPSKAMDSHPNEWQVSHCPTVWAFAAISLHMLSTRMEHTRNSFLWHLVSPNQSYFFEIIINFKTIEWSGCNTSVCAMFLSNEWLYQGAAHRLEQDAWYSVALLQTLKQTATCYS